jgi:hypothetical protein
VFHLDIEDFLIFSCYHCLQLHKTPRCQWRAPKFLVRPKRVQLYQRAKVDGTWCHSQLPALKGVRGACWKLRD